MASRMELNVIARLVATLSIEELITLGTASVCVGLAILALLYVGFCASVELVQSRRMGRLARAAWFEQQARIHRETGS
jgi:hypothetical protein